MKSVYVFLIFVAFYSFNARAAASGMDLYLQNCSVCHGDDGSGAMPGVSELTKSGEWIAISNKRLLDSINKGITKSSSPLPMPPKGGNSNLKDQEILSIIKYMKIEFSKR